MGGRGASPRTTVRSENDDAFETRKALIYKSLEVKVRVERERGWKRDGRGRETVQAVSNCAPQRTYRKARSSMSVMLDSAAAGL